MIVLGMLSMIIGGPLTPLTPLSDKWQVSEGPVVAAVALVDTNPPGPTIPMEPIPADTPRVRRKAVEVSDWYSRRLTIHRYVAYATIPVFAAQWAAGDRLFKHEREAPTWAKSVHRIGATTLAGMFTVNTVTGAWNWWDGRSSSSGRTLRTLHALSMLGADAAFTWAGVKLSDEAETSSDKRRLHRTVALSAMGVTVASGTIMKLWNR